VGSRDYVGVFKLSIRTFFAGACGAAALLGAASAGATTDLQDGSFEQIGAAIGGTSSWSYIYLCGDAGYPGGGNCTWQGSSAGVQGDQNGDWPGSSAPIAAQDGHYYAMIQDVSVLAQIFVASATGQYQLSWADAGRGNAYPGVFGDQGYNVVIASGPTLTTQQTVYSGATTTGQRWEDHSSTTFNLVAGQAYMLAFMGNSGHDNSAYIDNVRLTFSGGNQIDVGAVPEPASWGLMVGGFGLVGGAMRRRKAAVRFA